MSTQQRPVVSAANRNDGAWLCAAGPYLNFISHMNDVNPGIGLPDPKNEYIGYRVGQSRSVVLELKSDVTWSCKPFQNALEVKGHLRERSSTSMQAANPRKRIYILEGLDPQYVEAYGSHFFMDPSFFIRHERNDLFNLKRSEFHIHDPPPLPSLKDPENYFRVKYREIRQFGPQLRDWRTTCALTGRHIAAIGFEGKLDTIGSIARKFSFWSQKYADGGWDGMCSLLRVCEQDEGNNMTSGHPLRSPRSKSPSSWLASKYRNASKRAFPRRISQLHQSHD